ncbi:invasion associated locus B family protein [Bosea sp. 117]|uniref:invasion associated locus B family protein n=1 Tax=Bosea sp. 117 TaxID=1125973 RepID=UPI000493F9A0|nr:invasion associated locus B family protein [Bosea sp. 117]
MIRRSSLVPRILSPRLAAVCAAALIFGAPAAMAQTPAANQNQQKPAAKPAANQQKPAAPQQQGAAPAGAGQGTSPQTAQQIPAVAIPWVKRCADEPQIKKQVCNMEQTIITDTGQFLVRFGLFEVKDDPKKMFTVAFPTGLLLRNGFRVALANEQPLTGTFVMCDERVCRGDIQVDQAFIDRMKKAPGLTLQVANSVGRIISYPIGLGEFGKLYDGPNTDQKAFEEQVAKIQEQVKARQQQLATEQQQMEQKTKQGLEKLGAEKLKQNPAPAQ